jgi:microcin C transport system permease protein
MKLFSFKGLAERRWQLFKANKRGFWSLWIFLAVFVVSLLAPILANDKPILASYKGELLFPLLVEYPEEKFGGFRAKTDYSDPYNIEEITKNGWILFPPLRYSFDSVNKEIPRPAPSPPAFLLSKEERCGRYAAGLDDPACIRGNMNWLGTDDQGRDVIARLIYGVRISITFGLILTFLASVIGFFVGAMQGYFGGWTDLVSQRVLEVWEAIPSLYLLIIVAAFVTPTFWLLLFILLFFSWTSLVRLVRAEFLRARNFEYIRAARALGLTDLQIIMKHMLPNALVSTVTFMPFILASSLTTLTALDFLGFGLPAGSASLGEMVQQGKTNIQAPWLGLTAFFTTSIMLTLLVFIGEAVRDALDPRKTLA